MSDRQILGTCLFFSLNARGSELFVALIERFRLFLRTILHYIQVQSLGEICIISSLEFLMFKTNFQWEVVH